jgi:hypothetical protein
MLAATNHILDDDFAASFETMEVSELPEEEEDNESEVSTIEPRSASHYQSHSKFVNFRIESNY